MSTKTAPSLDEAASASPANAEDDFDLVDSDLDVLSIPGSQDGVLTPAITTAEGPEHKEELCNSKKSLHRLDYQEFHDAIIHGDFNSVKQMLDDGADIERTAYDGGTPLVIAIYEHHMNIVALLLERGADVKHQVIDASPIFHAVSQKEYAPRIIQLLLDHGADLEDEVWPTRHETACCQNALHWAAEYDAIDAVDFLISKGLDINGTGLEGKTPLIYAAEKGHLAIVKLLLAKGAEIHERSRNGESALMWASSKGQHEVVDYLLNEGASVDDRAKDDTTSLSLASMFNHVAVVELLIKNGADVNTLSTTPEHWTPATFAANAGHVEVLQILLSHGADPKIAPGNGVTALGQAMKGGHQTTVEILLEALGGPEYPKDTVALQMAIAQSHAAMRSLMTTVSIMYRYINPKHIGSEKLGWVKWVLDQGGELLRSRAMVNMLRAAISHDDVSMATELLNLGADSNTIFDSGYTPLHVAVSRRNMDLIKLLLEAGADPAKPTQDPKGLKLTPLHQAIMDWKDGSIKAISVINLLLASRRCRVMEGEELESTAFASVVRQLNHCNDEVASQADELVHSMIGSTNVNDDRSDDRSTLMHVAFHYKQKELIDALQCAGADINSRNNNNLDGPTPLLAACQSDVEEVKFLITRGADVSVVSNHGEGLLQLAAGRGQVEVLKFLLDLDRADEEPLDIDAVDEAGHTPLTSAISANFENAALFLLERGASTKCRTSDGQYAIHYAIQNNMQRAIDKILEDTSIDNVKIEDNKRWTPLALACIHSDLAVVTKLLSLGADPHIANHKTGDQPLHIALKRPREWPPADERCSGRALDLIDHKGIDLTAPDASGSTPLHLASERQHFLVTKLLLSKGLSPHCEDNRGRTPLCLCSEPDIAQALIDHGADVNHSDENGWTPLHYAVSRCWVKAFAVLREAGADMEARTRNDGLSVKERLAKFGTFEDWVNKEREIFNVYDDEQREEWVKYAGM